MGLKMKVCAGCGQRKKIGASKRRCKQCRTIKVTTPAPETSKPIVPGVCIVCGRSAKTGWLYCRPCHRKKHGFKVKTGSRPSP